jgi:hypothetical protein
MAAAVLVTPRGLVNPTVLESTMSNVPTSRPSPTQQPKPLLPVEVVGRFMGGATPAEIAAGAAVLAISHGDATDMDVRLYWVASVFDGARLVGFKLAKFGTADAYQLPATLDACDCGDGVYRSERPGGCRHQQALRQAITASVTPADAVLNAAAGDDVVIDAVVNEDDPAVDLDERWVTADTPDDALLDQRYTIITLDDPPDSALAS